MAYISPILTVMTSAARKAGRTLVRDFGEVENLQVSKKGAGDFVSAADLQAEKTLYALLSKARPDYGFLMEEAGAVDGAPGSEHRWIIDPLDGTTNFLHGLPHFAISLGLEKAGEIVAGVVYNPVTDEMFMAEKGQGAFLNDRRLRVAARQRLEDAIFATGIPFRGKENHELFLKQLAAVMANSAGVRRYGSAALDLAWLAAGRYDGYWEADLNAWDIAAGLLIAREAGAYVSDMDGRDDMLKKGSILAANPSIHGRLHKLLTQAASA